MTDVTATATTPVPADRRALLRTALRLDAVVTAANGLVYVVAAGPLGELLGLSPALLRAAAVVMLAWAPAVWLVAARPAPAAGTVRAVVAGNALWATASLVAAGAGWADPTTIGTAWIVAQGLVVGGFAALQAAGLRRAGR